MSKSPTTVAVSRLTQARAEAMLGAAHPAHPAPPSKPAFEAVIRRVDNGYLVSTHSNDRDSTRTVHTNFAAAIAVITRAMAPPPKAAKKPTKSAA